jgi:hypothetical protein
VTLKRQEEGDRLKSFQALQMAKSIRSKKKRFHRTVKRQELEPELAKRALQLAQKLPDGMRPEGVDFVPDTSPLDVRAKCQSYVLAFGQPPPRPVARSYVPTLAQPPAIASDMG